MSPLITTRAGASANAYGWGAAVAAGTSFDSIQTITVPTATSTISFTSIPTTYKHLQIRFIARSDATDTEDIYKIVLNSDTTAVYSGHYYRGNGTTTQTSYLNGFAYMYGNVFAAASTTASIYSPGFIDFHNYTSTTQPKVVRMFGGVENAGVAYSELRYTSGAWFPGTNAAINSITLTVVRTGQGGNFKENSHFALYGIKG